jgi:hypothetical protein
MLPAVLFILAAHAQCGSSGLFDADAFEMFGSSSDVQPWSWLLLFA